MVVDLRYFNSLELEVDSLTSQLETQRTQFVNGIDRLSREYYYANHMNAILGVYTKLDEVTNLQCDYLELFQKCKGLEIELSKSKMMSKSFESVQKHAINLELELQQYLKAQLQDKGIVISELRNLMEKQKGKSVDTKFEKSSVIRKPNAFKSQRPSLVEIVQFIVDSRCSNHMTGNLKLLINFMEKFLGTVKFGNDQIAHILGYDLEVAFRKSTCFIRDLKGNDLLSGSRGTDLYSITLQDINSPNPICLVAKVTLSQAWLWHRRLSHLNFDTINLLSKNDIVVGLPKDETHEVIIDFLRLVQRGLQAQVGVVRTNKGTEFLNQTLHAYFAAEGFNTKRPLLEHLNKTALSKDETILLLRLLEQC
nr:hypothetical protein [Tanacetum cinerariifolium]